MSVRKKSLIASVVSFVVFAVLMTADSWFRIYQLNKYDDIYGKDITFQIIIFIGILAAPIYLFISYFGFKYSRGGYINKPIWLGVTSGSVNTGLTIAMEYFDQQAYQIPVDPRVIMATTLLITSILLPHISTFRVRRSGIGATMVANNSTK